MHVNEQEIQDGGSKKFGKRSKVYVIVAWRK